MLYEEFMEECELLEPSKVPDGHGGTITTWTSGEKFDAAIVERESMVITTAEHLEESKKFNITSTIKLNFHDVIRRKSDQTVFRITSDSKPSPETATFRFRRSTAERWKL